MEGVKESVTMEVEEISTSTLQIKTGGEGESVGESAKIPPMQNSAEVKEEGSKPMSKNQLKKLAHKQKWEAQKKEKRAREKSRRKELRAMRKQKADYVSRGQKKRNIMENSSCTVAIAVDCSFNHLMIEKDLAKCIKQIDRCYSVNRKVADPVQYYVTSFGGLAQEMIKKHAGWERWDIHFTEKDYMSLEKYPKEKIIYLTSESENVIEKVEPDYLYVIGGLVDHNGHKGLCHELAVKNQVNHARLPIQEYLDMKTRKILTIDHVFHILLKVAKGESWQSALLDVIAPRKMAKPKALPEVANDNDEETLKEEDIDS